MPCITHGDGCNGMHNGDFIGSLTRNRLSNNSFGRKTIQGSTHIRSLLAGRVESRHPGLTREVLNSSRMTGSTPWSFEHLLTQPDSTREIFKASWFDPRAEPWPENTLGAYLPLVPQNSSDRHLKLLRRTVENVSCLTSLTELNLRRNSIEKVRLFTIKLIKSRVVVLLSVLYQVVAVA